MVPEDQSVPLVLLVLLVLSTTSVAAGTRLRVFISHDLDLQLFRLQTHIDDAARSCGHPLTFYFPAQMLWIGLGSLRTHR
jgi:hypothetical protein